MFETLNTNIIKNRLADYISRMISQVMFSFDEITNKIIYHDFFDFLEENQIDKFFNMSYEQITREIYNIEYRFNVSKEIPAEVYWAVSELLTISFNKMIPLKQVLLLCPLDEMVAHFNIYHEMNDLQIIDEFMSNEYKRSILRTLRLNRNITIPTLASLTGIKEVTLKAYEGDNEKLFSASFDNITKLKEVLGASDSLFNKDSKFIPLCNALFLDKKFQEKLCDNILSMTKIYDRFHYRAMLDSSSDNIKVWYSEYLLPDQDKILYAKENKNALIIDGLFCLIQNGKKTYLDTELCKIVVRNTAVEFLRNDDRLWF